MSLSIKLSLYMAAMEIPTVISVIYKVMLIFDLFVNVFFLKVELLLVEVEFIRGDIFRWLKYYMPYKFVLIILIELTYAGKLIAKETKYGWRVF
jgi:hypothetical protein